MTVKTHSASPFIGALLFVGWAVTATADDAAAQKRFLEERFFGTFTAPDSNWRMWISEGETVIVRVSTVKNPEDIAQTLANRQLIGAVLERATPPDPATIERLGFSIRCSRFATKVLFASPTAMVVVTRTLPADAKETVDTRYQLSGHWSAVYASHRALEMLESGALPLASKEEVALAKTLPLDELPFTPPFLMYRRSSQSTPSAGWCD